jgi:hypothetical protein
VIRVPRRVFQPVARAADPRSDASRCTTSSSTRFENIAERKLRRRQLTEDGNVEISGRVPDEGGARSPGGAS